MSLKIFILSYVYYCKSMINNTCVGTLDSAVVAGPVGSREFRLQAGDGVLRCLYWEIDTTLPHLVRGKPIRSAHIASFPDLPSSLKA